MIKKIFLWGTLGLMVFVIDAIDYTIVQDGLRYAHDVSHSAHCSIHVAMVDPAKLSIIVQEAHSKCKATEMLSSMAQKKGALLAINGGFFDFGQKNTFWDNWLKILDFFGIRPSYTYPVFGLKIVNEWYSISSKKTGALAWSHDGVWAEMGVLHMNVKLIINSIFEIPIQELNKPYAQGPIIYTSVYDEKTEKKDNVIEVIVENGFIKDIVENGGLTVIPKNGYVCAFQKKHIKNIKKWDEVKVGSLAKIQITYENDSSLWEDSENILGSTPLLVKNGVITETVEKGTSSFFTKKHPRTAVGLLKNGQWVFVVVEGRCKKSKGMSLRELAEYMKDVGCVHALNLDGGGSSLMVVKGVSMNVPSGRKYGVRGERPISNSILVVSK